MAFEPSTLSVTTIEGYSVTVPFSGKITGLDASGGYILLEEEQNLVVDGDFSGDNLQIQGHLVFAGSEQPGTYKSNLVVHLCPDANCASEFPGSPFSLPLVYQVIPNISVQSPSTMSRKGQEPAPTQSVTVTAPVQAGALGLEIESSTDQAFVLKLEGNAVQISTTQMRAGSYQASVTVTGSADTRYRASFDVLYTVLPPEGGEREPYFEPSVLNLAQAQGVQTTHRFKLVRPTWTADMTPVAMTDSPAIKNLRSLGNDEYEVTVDTANLPTDMAQSSTVTSSTLDGGITAGLAINVSVESIAYLGNGDFGTINVNAETPASALLQASPIVTTDGKPATWTATSDQPWLKLRSSSGLAGVDALQVEADPSVLGLGDRVQVAQVSIRLNRPGSLPLTVPVTVTNDLPRLEQASPSVMVATSGRVWVHGSIFQRTGVLKPGVLSVSGATLRSAQIVLDSRFVGDVGMLALDLEDVQLGTPVTLTAQGELGTSQLTLTTRVPPQVPGGHLTLPFGAYRPASYLPGLGALVWASEDKVWKWQHQGTGWAAARSTRISGLVDAVPSLDEAKVLATYGRNVRALRSDTLGILGTASLPEPGALFGADSLDPGVPGLVHGLAIAADGRGFASKHPNDNPDDVHAVGWISGANSYGFTPDLSLSPRFADPGSGFGTTPVTQGRGAGIVRSTHGRRLAFSHSDGLVQLYRGLGQSMQRAGVVEPGEVATAVSDSGNWLFSSDGILHAVPWQPNGSQINMAQRVPAGFVAGGFGLTGSGKLALVYGYRVVEGAAGPRATDATLWVYDTTNSLYGLTQPEALVATLPMTSPVGCTTVLSVGESCRHRASITVAAGDRSVFILGPRGIEALTLPDSVASLGARKGAAAVAPKPGLPSAPVPLDGRPFKR